MTDDKGSIAEVAFVLGGDDMRMHVVDVDDTVAAVLGLQAGLQHEVEVWAGGRDDPSQASAVQIRSVVDGGEFRLRVAPRLAAHLGVGPGRGLFLRRVELEPCDEVELRASSPLPGLQPETASRYVSRVLSREFFPLSEGMELAVSFPGVGRPLRLRVEAATPSPARFTARTRVGLLPPESPGTRVDPTGYRDIGGLGRQLQELRELLEFPLRAPEALRQAGITPCRAVLLFGPPGTGKSLMVHALADETGAHLEVVRGSEIAAAGAGSGLADTFTAAAARAPAIVLIDEVDALAPRRDGAGAGAVTMVADIAARLDALRHTEGVVVVATTDRVNAVDPSLRRPGRFARELHVPPPDAAGRLEILRIHGGRMPLDEDAERLLARVAERTHGYVGADLMGLTFEAGMNALRRVVDVGASDPFGERWQSALAELSVGVTDFERALEVMRPSALREVYFAATDVSWDDIAGCEGVKERLHEVVSLPLQRPEVFAELRLRPSRGVVLYGPPGNGKTMLAKAIASECDANFLLVKGPELFTKWVGESEERLRETFQVARQTRPCIIFVDEIDALLPARGGDRQAGVADSMVNQFLAEFDGVEAADGVVVIGATNRLDRLDPAVLRPGRLGEHIEIGPPGAVARRVVLELQLDGIPMLDADGLDPILDQVVAATDGWSGAELVELIDRAKYRAVRAAEGGAPLALVPAWLLEERRALAGPAVAPPKPPAAVRRFGG